MSVDLRRSCFDTLLLGRNLRCARLWTRGLRPLLCAKVRELLDFCEVFVDEADRHRALAYGRGDTIHGACTHIARCEYTRTTGLQQIGVPILLPDLFEVGMEGQVASRF